MRILEPSWWLGNSFRSYKYDPNISVTIVIPAYNEEDFINDTIESCLAQSHSCRVIVVDDHSTDKTSEIASKLCEVLRTPKNQGSKSMALNYAINSIDSDIFICVDADTILDEDAVEKLVSSFSDPKKHDCVRVCYFFP